MPLGSFVLEAHVQLRNAVGLPYVRFDTGHGSVRLRANTPQSYVVARSALGEGDSIRDLVRGLKADDVFYDVGANVGLYALSAAKRGARVFAFEPAPANFHALEENVRVNMAGGVKPLRLALGDERGELPFFTSGDDAGSQINSLRRDVVDRFGIDAREIKVEICRMDDLVESGGYPAPTLVKIDVEGAEGKVLRGARRTLEAHRPILQVELHPGAMEIFGDSKDSILALLHEMGYAARVEEMRHCLKVNATPHA